METKILPGVQLRHQNLDADFVIVGGGMAGVCAALAAARNGCSVVLVQNRSVLGGNASSEVRMHIVGADVHGSRPGARESGIIEELRLEDAFRNPHRSYSQWDLLLYEKILAEPKITLLLDSEFISCTADEKGVSILSIQVLRNSTEDLFQIKGRFFADCSGDARLGAEAGADFLIGRESQEEYGESLALAEADHFTLGSSILITGRLYDTPQTFRSPSWSRRFTANQLRHRPIHSFEYGYWWFEWGGKLDTIKDNADIIRHELLRIALGIWDYIKNSGNYPEAANWALDWVGSIPGKRESRRLLGPHVMTQSDVAAGRIFPDTVAYGGWPIDLHPPGGVDAEDEPPYTPTQIDGIYGIPLRALYSRNIDNLLFAGRNISASHVAFASTRVMATCAVVGQAVGTAAAVACRQNLSLREMSQGDALGLLQQQLLKDDAFLPNIRAGDESDQARGCATVKASSEVPGHEASLLCDGLNRDLIGRLGPWADGAVHHWRSTGLPAWVELGFSGPITIRSIHLTFDSGFQRELMLTLSDHLSKRTLRGAQPEVVKSYRIYADGKLVVTEDDNFLRKRVHELPEVVTVSSLRIEILATHGVPEARVFEVRAY